MWRLISFISPGISVLERYYSYKLSPSPNIWHRRSEVLYSHWLDHTQFMCRENFFPNNNEDKKWNTQKSWHFCSVPLSQITAATCDKKFCTRTDLIIYSKLQKNPHERPLFSQQNKQQRDRIKEGKKKHPPAKNSPSVRFGLKWKKETFFLPPSESIRDDFMCTIGVRSTKCNLHFSPTIKSV